MSINDKGFLIGQMKELNIGFIRDEIAHYKFNIITKRLSGAEDVIPCVISETVLEKFKEENAYKIPLTVKVEGELRSRNVRLENRSKSKLVLYFKVSKLSAYEEDASSNALILNGTICKPPVYRKTPLGREITDILLAINIGNASSYIPLILWGYNASAAARYNVGEKILISGRIQSRVYQKDEREHVAYEVSVNKCYHEKDTDLHNQMQIIEKCIL